MQLAEDYSLSYASVRASVNLGSSLTTEDLRQGWDIVIRGIEEAKRTGHRSMLATLAANASTIGLRIGAWREALDVATELLSTGMDPSDQYVLEGVSTILRVVSGQPYADQMERVVAFAAHTDEPALQSVRYAAGGWAAFVDARFSEAHASFMTSATTSDAQASEDAPMAGRAALWARDRAAAEQAAERLRQTGIHGRVIHACTHTLDAGLAALDGDLDRAATGYADAARDWRELNAPFELALCDLDFVRFVGGERPEVDEAAREAREIGERLGATWLLGRLDEALGLGREAALA
jgi:hypothetical protein